MTSAERAETLLAFLLLDGAVSFLFFRSWWAFGIFLPFYRLFRELRREDFRKKHQRNIREQFLTGMQFVSTSLSAGYAVENAFLEGEKELKKIYDPDTYMVRSFHRINDQVRINRPLETLLLELARSSEAEDILQFAEVFQAARRSGGDLIAIIRNTVNSIQAKEETQKEIETALSGKMMEQTMMSFIPLLILGYVSLTSPEFLEPMYQTLAGRAMMAASLAVYGFAVWWGRKMMDIQV
ncbi:MAG: type II secretion system F family protein [Lachnospiraceae bacterium]|nr:type II secretion system F family protein [Lachnospiraceae bacterium]